MTFPTGKFIFLRRRAASASTLTAPADSESLSKPSFRLGLNQIQPRQCS
uniref:Uncharacterized protein n=1 Tax=Siphoviridae sp. ctwHj1 TaxID=2825727 RepID=A0A8S5U671_9CAUD|nr:MAG TPA: hypothetical protein [Siphoviridae sp. ctwHj1]